MYPEETVVETEPVELGVEIGVLAEAEAWVAVVMAVGGGLSEISRREEESI